ncbi:MAG: PEP/pyruvate-binding domain-containing protein [Candidatus Riflebacteria bacterium]|nr:PEP/pyruvate-binding domain-containing protein [Candidatus Riflebacteria bacterium]
MVVQRPEWKVIVNLLRETNPVLLNRIGRKMMNLLFKRNVKEIEILLQKLNLYKTRLSRERDNYENQPTPRVNYSLLSQLIDETFEIAEEKLTEEDISSMVNLWLKQEQFRFLSMAAEKRDVPLGEIHEAVHRFSMIPGASKNLSKEEKMAVRVSLIRRFLSDDLDYISSLKECITVADFAQVLSRTIGPAKGNGKLGGKASGLLRAEQIIHAAKPDNIVLRNLAVPKTWFITSDGVLDFLHFNALEEMPTIKYRDPAEIRQEYAYVGQIFKNSALSSEIMTGLSLVLEDMGDRPLVVRSSSLLEDTKGSSFAGKYKSLFVPNQGKKRDRLEALKDAVVEVYASTFGPDPIEYRRERGLLDFNEEMGIMIQEVVGTKVGKYYFPAFAGVAFSYNEFRWSPRIKREDGIVRLVTGFGTRAVDRIGDDYPMLVCPGQPGLRANASPEDILRYSQKCMDLINLETGLFETVPIETVIKDTGVDFPLLSYLISIYDEGQISTPIGTGTTLKSGIPVITFENLLKRSPFISQIKSILGILKTKLGWPVDVEFAVGEDVHTLYLLQCRPQSHASGLVSVEIPTDLEKENVLFTAKKYVTSADVRDIEYIVYVDPLEYDSLETLDEMLAVGSAVGELNFRLPHRKFILMGPGRWGSRGDIKLGVKVAYSDINNTCMLIEIARNKMGYTPDLSFGTHFFQDLVEAEIRYLPLYPDDEGNLFNEDFLKNSDNHLRKFIPSAQRLEKVLRVISTSTSARGKKLSILMDGENDSAVGFFQ